jgi:alpha-L-fucosidase
MIRKLQPSCLISYKWGVTDTEDFYAPEFNWPRKQPDRMAQAVAAGKPIELCQGIAGWGYQKSRAGKHRGAGSFLADLKQVRQIKAQTLLLNTGPLPDGSIDPQDVASLREVGKRIRKDGWPTA